MTIDENGQVVRKYNKKIFPTINPFDLMRLIKCYIDIYRIGSLLEVQKLQYIE